MSSPRTRLSELATAAGMCWDPGRPWPDALEDLTIPGIDDDHWRPVVLPATATSARDRRLLLTALENGRAFREAVLAGRRPRKVEWTGGLRTTWSADVPRDLVVDEAYFVQAKFNSRCVLNRAPAAVFDDLLLERDEPPARSWFEEVAPLELHSYWSAVHEALGDDDLPAALPDLEGRAKARLKEVLRGRETTTAAEVETYAELCRAVSERTADRWQARWARATGAVQARLLMRLLRISGGPYWLLGTTRGTEPVRLAVVDAPGWQRRFALRRFDAVPAAAGQPQVDWRAAVTDRKAGGTRVVEGYCEIRWSHGKLQGAPECKVQVVTPLADLPGYDQLEAG